MSRTATDSDGATSPGMYCRVPTLAGRVAAAAARSARRAARILTILERNGCRSGLKLGMWDYDSRCDDLRSETDCCRRAWER